MLALLLPCSAYGQAATAEGRVLDRVTELPVVGAQVTLSGVTNSTSPAQQLTDSTGQFYLDNLPAGDYLLRIERTGYLIASDTIHFAVGEEKRLVVRLAVDPLELTPITAEAASREYLGGFWERRAHNTGHFFTREEILASRAHTLTEVVRRVPGAKILNAGTIARVVSFERIRGPTACVAELYVDGRQFPLSERGLDDFAADDIAAVEVYSGASRVPAQFNATGKKAHRREMIATSPQCGVVVVWTRNGR